MERDPFFPGSKAVTLPVKDALRGTRAMLRRASAAIAPTEDRNPVVMDSLAEPVQLAPHVAKLAFEVGQLLQNKPLVDTPSGSSFNHFGDVERDGAMFASAIRHGLAFCFKRFGKGHYLVSETLAAGAFWSGRRKSQEDDPPAMLAAHLYRSLTRHHIAAHAPGTPLGMEDDDLNIVKQAVFATTIWLLVERDEPHENESEVLGLCADVVMSLRAEIEVAETDPRQLARLLASYADVI